jgi:hypothetical protein
VFAALASGVVTYIYGAAAGGRTDAILDVTGYFR